MTELGRHCYTYPHPALTTDVALFTILDDRLQLLLVRRGHAPCAGSWALPGGFLDMDEELDQCAARELAEEHVSTDSSANAATPGPLPDAVVGHLDKSHITVHTYPESHPHNGISTFRADIDVSTCGLISPLKALNYLIHALESDIVIMDYRVRGFTRDVNGRKHFIDHNISSIQNYLSRDTKNRYQMIDVNLYQENLFHTKMVVDQFRLDDYLFCIDVAALSDKEYGRIQRLVRREMMEIFYGRNLRRDIAGWNQPRG
jgi:S-adenosylmethionine decarboxylase